MTRDAALLLAALAAVSQEVAELRRAFEAVAGRVVANPDILTTDQAVRLARSVRPRFCRATLLRWVADGRLSDIQHPRRYRREEIERALAGVPVSREARGRRRTPAPRTEAIQ